MPEKRCVLTFARPFSPAEDSSSNRGALHKKGLEDTPRKGLLRNTKDNTSSEEVRIINLAEVHVASPSSNQARTERSSASSSLLRRSARKSSDCSSSQPSSKITVAGHPATAEVIRNVTEESTKTRRRRLRDHKQDLRHQYIPALTADPEASCRLDTQTNHCLLLTYAAREFATVDNQRTSTSWE